MNKGFITLLFLAMSLVGCKDKSNDSGVHQIVNPDSVALTPPMGWNSYNAFGATVRESEVKENADFIATNLRKYGWEYIVVDFCWFYPHHPNSIQDNPPQFRLPKDSSYVPWLAMDKYGRLLPDPGKFPSAKDGEGFKLLADYIHNQGLKFGIHVMRGIPRQAVWEKSLVKGIDGVDASMIADTTSTCVWLNNMYGLDMSKKGAQEYLNSLFELYAEWGVDFVKVDDILSPYYAPEIEGFRKAINQCGRSIVLSTSLNASPDKADHISKYANMWRISADFWDNWSQLCEMFEYANNWTPYRRPGAWPDCDMLLLGRLSRRGPVGKERETNFTKDEQLTHFTLWSIAKSPLMFGGDLRVSDQFTISLISNPDAIEVNQSSKNNRQVRNSNGIVIWTADDNETKKKYVALFNINNGKPLKISVSWKEIGLNGDFTVRDLWEKKELGKFKDEFSAEVSAHGCMLISVTD